MDPNAPFESTLEEIELTERAEEMSPHDKALYAVLRLWTTLSYPIAIIAALVVATIVATTGHTSVNSLMLLATYGLIAVPGTIGCVMLQTRARGALARRIIRSLDEGAAGAISAGITPAGFLGSGAISGPPRADLEPHPDDG